MLNGYIKGNEDMTFEQGLQILQNKFKDYIKTQVLSKVEVDDLGKHTTNSEM